MPLIDTTYFDGDLIIAGLNSSSGASALNAAIATYEDEYLRSVLGASLYAAFTTALAGANRSYFDPRRFSSRFLTSNLDERWAWVRDGHTYTVNGQTYIWPGLVNRRQSPLAAYVYWQYRADTATTTATIAEVKGKSENATSVSPDRKMMRAWNKMAEANRVLVWMLQYVTDGNVSIYPEFQLQEADGNVFASQNLFGV